MDQIKDIHEKEYGVSPEVVYATPGRFHVMGEHSWFFKDKTISMAIDRFVYIAVSFRDDNFFNFYFKQLNDRKRISLEGFKFRKDDRWANSIKSVIFGYLSNGYSLRGMDFTIYSDMLPSAGLGIKTAITVGAAFAINDLCDFDCSDNEILAVIEKGNKSFLKAENYVADNFSAIYSSEKSLILTNHEDLSYENIPFDFENKTILLVDAKVPRIEIWDERTIYEEKNALIMGDLKERTTTVYGGWMYSNNRAEISEIFSIFPEDVRRHLDAILSEHQCVLDAYNSLRKKSFAGFAKAVNKSHENMRDLYTITCPEIDWILKRLVEINPTPDESFNPVCCGRITGKGFGRCIYAILDNENIPEFEKRLAEYAKIFGFHASCYTVKPARGVHRVQ